MKKPFNVRYTDGTIKNIYNLSISKVGKFKQLYKELKRAVKNPDIFDKKEESLYKIYLKSEKFKELIDNLHYIFNIEPDKLNEDDLFEFFLPWEEFKENEKGEIKSYIHPHGKLYGYIFPYTDQKTIIETDVIDKTVEVVQKTHQLVKEVDQMFGYVVPKVAEEFDELVELREELIKICPQLGVIDSE